MTKPKPPAKGAILRALLNQPKQEALRDVVFALRELVGLPKAAWTEEQKQWWASANIQIGMIKSQAENE